MQRENKWQDRFNDKFPNIVKEIDCFGMDSIFDFFQSEINRAVAEERGRVKEIIENMSTHTQVELKLLTELFPDGNSDLISRTHLINLIK